MSRRVPLSQQVDLDTLDERTTPHRWGMTLTYEVSLDEAGAIDPREAPSWRPGRWQEPLGAFGPVCLVCHAVRVPGGYAGPCEEEVPEGTLMDREVHAGMSRAARRRRAREQARSKEPQPKVKEPLPEGWRQLLGEGMTVTLPSVPDGFGRKTRPSSHP